MDSVENKVISEVPNNISMSFQQAMLMFNIINVVSKRGAILPAEFKPVGDLYEFLHKELKIDEQVKLEQQQQQQ